MREKGDIPRACRHFLQLTTQADLVREFNNVPLRTMGPFELQKVLNDLAEKYSESVVKHARMTSFQ